MDWTIVTVPTLHTALRHRGVETGSRLRKAALVSMLQRHDAARRLQRFVRARGAAPVNEVDPITLQHIWRRPRDAGTLFSVSTDSGHRYVYTPRALAHYINTSRNRVDPITRRPLTPAELRRLAAQSGIASTALVRPMAAAAETVMSTELLQDLVLVLEGPVVEAYEYIYMQLGQSIVEVIETLQAFSPYAVPLACLEFEVQLRAIAATQEETMRNTLVNLSNVVANIRSRLNAPPITRP